MATLRDYLGRTVLTGVDKYALVHRALELYERPGARARDVRSALARAYPEASERTRESAREWAVELRRQQRAGAGRDLDTWLYWLSTGTTPEGRIPPQDPEQPLTGVSTVPGALPEGWAERWVEVQFYDDQLEIFRREIVLVALPEGLTEARLRNLLAFTLAQAMGDAEPASDVLAALMAALAGGAIRWL